MQVGGGRAPGPDGGGATSGPGRSPGPRRPRDRAWYRSLPDRIVTGFLWLAIAQMLVQWGLEQFVDDLGALLDLGVGERLLLLAGALASNWILKRSRPVAPAAGRPGGRTPGVTSPAGGATGGGEGRPRPPHATDRRRQALGIAVLLATIAAVTALRVDREPEVAAPDPTDDCGRTPPPGALDVLVVWEDEELRAFCDTLAGYGPGVAVATEGEGIEAALDARLDDPPDVALIPQPSLVRHHAANSRLCPVEPEVRVLFPAEWNRFVTEQDGGNGPERVFGAFVKATHKTVLWFDMAAFREHGPVGQPGYFGPPYDWDHGDLVAWLEANAHREGYEAPLTLPVREQWPLTDWFENQLAAQAPDVYDALSSREGAGAPGGGEGTAGEADLWADEEVVAAIEGVLWEMAELWRQPDLFPDGVGDGGPGLAEVAAQLEARTAAIGFAPSVLAGPIERTGGALDIGVVGFPGPEEPPRPTGTLPTFGDRPVIVGADIAAVFKQDGGDGRPRCGEVVDDARDFVRWLTDTEAMAAWARNDPGFLTPNARSPHVAGGADVDDATAVYLTAALRESGDQLFFDLSDDQFARGGGSTGRVWEVFSDFFTAIVVDRAPPEGPIACVIARLRAEDNGEDWPAPCEDGA